jgi:hypothetical protein
MSDALRRVRTGQHEEVWHAPPVTLGVAADTHVPLRARRLPRALLDRLRGSDLILHAGDLVDLAVLTTLATIAPVLAVAGNSDPPSVVAALPSTVLLHVGTIQIGLVHGHGLGSSTVERARQTFGTVDAVVFGHTHQPLQVVVDGTLLFNPGSATDRRRQARCSCGRIRVTSAGLVAELFPV